MAYLDHDTATLHHLAWLSFLVNFAQAYPLTKFGIVINLTIDNNTSTPVYVGVCLPSST